MISEKECSAPLYLGKEKRRGEIGKQRVLAQSNAIIHTISLGLTHLFLNSPLIRGAHASPPARGGVPSRRGGVVGEGRNKRDGCVKISLAWILDHLCHMRGVVKGPTALFERQPIVLVNTGGAKAEEVEALAREVADCVRKKTGIEVEWEVAFIGGGKSRLAR